MNGYFGTHYFGRLFSKGSSPAPVGRLLIVNAGELTCAAGSGLRGDSNRRGRIETRQCAVEEFLKIVDTLPQPMGAIVADCARAGIRRGQGRSGAPRSLAEKTAREAAMREKPQLFGQYLAEARAVGRHNPRRWAQEEAAKAVRRKMLELGVADPPAVSTIMKKREL